MSTLRRMLIFAAFVAALVVLGLQNPIVHDRWSMLAHRSPLLLMRGMLYSSAIATRIGCSVQQDMSCLHIQDAKRLVNVFGYSPPGIGVQIATVEGENQRVGPALLSYKAVHAQMRNPHLKRHPLFALGVNIARLPPGVVPEDIQPTLFQLDSDDPQRLTRLVTMSEVFSQLGEHPKRIKFVGAPPHPVNVSRADGSDVRQIFNLVAVNLFRVIFKVDITSFLDQMYTFSIVMAQISVGATPTPQQVGIMNTTRAAVELFVREVSREANLYAKTMTQKGEDGDMRLREVIFYTLTMGLSSICALVRSTMLYIMKNPKEHAKRFRMDNEKFVLEAARLFPPIDGANPYVVGADSLYTLANGRRFKEREGDTGLMYISTANRDPAVFGEDSEAFDENRLNLEQLLTFNDRLEAIRQCKVYGKCIESPRGCPGTYLSLFLTTQSVAYFVEGYPADKDEL